jgi:hypothetical protein
MDDLPIALCDVLGIEGGAHNDLPRDRHCRHAHAVGLQIGSEQGGGGSERRFAEYAVDVISAIVVTQVAAPPKPFADA